MAARASRAFRVAAVVAVVVPLVLARARRGRRRRHARSGSPSPWPPPRSARCWCSASGGAGSPTSARSPGCWSAGCSRGPPWCARSSTDGDGSLGRRAARPSRPPGRCRPRSRDGDRSSLAHAGTVGSTHVTTLHGPAAHPRGGRARPRVGQPPGACSERHTRPTSPSRHTGRGCCALRGGCVPHEVPVSPPRRGIWRPDAHLRFSSRPGSTRTAWWWSPRSAHCARGSGGTSPCSRCGGTAPRAPVRSGPGQP